MEIKTWFRSDDINSLSIYRPCLSARTGCGIEEDINQLCQTIYH